MRNIYSAILVSVSLILTGCISMPTPGTGVTVGKTKYVCSNVAPKNGQNLHGFYIKSINASIPVAMSPGGDATGKNLKQSDKLNIKKVCKFRGAKIYFSDIAWNTWRKKLSIFPQNTTITPLYFDHVNTHYLDSFLISGYLAGSNKTEYKTLRFDGKRWDLQPLMLD